MKKCEFNYAIFLHSHSMNLFLHSQLGREIHEQDIDSCTLTAVEVINSMPSKVWGLKYDVPLSTKIAHECNVIRP